MAIEVNASKVICSKCGRSYSRRKGFFLSNYGQLYKGIGYVTVCKDCIDTMYNSYLSQCNNARDAARQVCRKLDLYWSDKVYEIVERKNTTHTVMTGYIAKINTSSYSGKSYDDTLSEEGTLWNWKFRPTIHSDPPKEGIESNNEEIEIPDEVVSFWGSGYTPETYQELEQRRQYYLSRLSKGSDLDIGSEILIKQICNLEVTISKDSAAGKSIDKSVNSLNTLLGSLNLKPTQQKDADSDADLISTPLGVWLYRYENKRPLPKTDESLRDVNHNKKYVFTWFGHVLKLLGIKNGYTKLYEEEISRLRVEKPEYADDDDETLIINSYSEDIQQECEKSNG